MQTDLSRDILAKHRNEAAVSKILALPYEKQVKELSLLKKQGILEHNKQLMAQDDSGHYIYYLQERTARKGRDISSGNEVAGVDEKGLKICGCYYIYYIYIIYIVLHDAHFQERSSPFPSTSSYTLCPEKSNPQNNIR